MTKQAHISIVFGLSGTSLRVVASDGLHPLKISCSTTLAEYEPNMLSNSFSRLPYSLKLETLMTSEQILTNCKIFQLRSRSNNGYGLMSKLSDGPIMRGKGFYQQPGQDYSYIAMPPYPPPSNSENRKSTLNILESGQGWPNLLPPVVGAKGAWIWQPATPSLNERFCDIKVQSNIGLARDLRPPFSRKLS